MQAMTPLINLIARIGTNPTFIAFNAHWGFAFFVTHWLPHAWPSAAACLAAAAVKEFWFDATYESPPQPFMDNLTDFGGYAVGVVVVLFT